MKKELKNIESFLTGATVFLVVGLLGFAIYDHNTLAIFLGLIGTLSTFQVWGEQDETNRA